MGLVLAIEELVAPTNGIEHKRCVRHIYANIKANYGGGIVLKSLIIKLRKVNSRAYNKLVGIKLRSWARAFFSFQARSDMIMNNISKAFNGRIIKTRDNPIIIMLDWIKVYWMIRFVEKKAKGLVYKGRVSPIPLKRLEKEIEQSSKWTTKWASA